MASSPTEAGLEASEKAEGWAESVATGKGQLEAECASEASQGVACISRPELHRSRNALPPPTAPHREVEGPLELYRTPDGVLMECLLVSGQAFSEFGIENARET